MPLGMGSQDWKLYARYSQLGFEMVAPILLGYGLDVWLESLPWCTVAGAVLSLFYMIWRLQRLLTLDGGSARGGQPGGR